MGFQNYPWSTGQSPVTSTPSIIVPAGTSHSGIIISNLGTVDIYIGENSTVSTTKGHLLVGVKGASQSFSTTAAIWAVSAGASTSISYAITQ